MDRSEIETVFKGAISMMQVAGRNLITDAQWKREKKSTLSGIKTHAELINIAEEIAEAESMIFEEMDSCIRTFMQRCHYNDNVIDEYLSCGLRI